MAIINQQLAKALEEGAFESYRWQDLPFVIDEEEDGRWCLSFMGLVLDGNSGADEKYYYDSQKDADQDTDTMMLEHHIDLRQL